MNYDVLIAYDQWPQVLDRYFGNVCELDIIFNFHKVSHSRQTDVFNKNCIPISWFRAKLPRASKLTDNNSSHAQAYYILDELFINGELQESSKKEVLSVCAQMDEMMDEAKDEGTTGAGKTGGKR